MDGDDRLQARVRVLVRVRMRVRTRERAVGTVGEMDDEDGEG